METSPHSPVPTLTPEQQADIEKNKDVAAMSYLWILSIVVLYARKDSPFVQYHARQGMWLFLVSIPLWMVPVFGQYLEFFILAGMIIGFLNAAQGKHHDIPVIGQLAKGTLTLMDIWHRVVTAVLKAVGVAKRGLRPSPKNTQAHQDASSSKEGFGPQGGVGMEKKPSTSPEHHEEKGETPQTPMAS